MNIKHNLPKLIIPGLLIAIYLVTLAKTIAEPEEPYSHTLQSASSAWQKEVQVMLLSPRQPQSASDQDLILVVERNQFSRAYDMADFTAGLTVFQAQLSEEDVVVFVDGDSQTALAYLAENQGQPLHFSQQGAEIRDASGSTWGMDGVCLSGPYAGTQLETVSTFFTNWGTWLAAHPQETLSTP